MKRINILLSLLLLIASCSFQNEAEKRLPAYMKSVVADPEQSIEDKTFVWSDDSLCIIEFKLRARNENGGYELTTYQYYLVKGDTAIYEGSNRLPYNVSFQDCLDGETYKPNIKKKYYELARSWGRLWGRRVE